MQHPTIPNISVNMDPYKYHEYPHLDMSKQVVKIKSRENRSQQVAKV